MNKNVLLSDISKLLEIDKSYLTDAFQLQHQGNWDSLSVISTVGAINAHYHVFVTGTELMGCKTIADIFSLIQSRIQESVENN